MRESGWLRCELHFNLAYVYILAIRCESRRSVHEVLHEVFAADCKNEARRLRPAGCQWRAGAHAAEVCRCGHAHRHCSTGDRGSLSCQGSFGRLPGRRDRQLRRRRRRAPELLLLLVPGQLLLSAAASEPTRGLQQHAAAATTNTHAIPPRAQTTSRTSSPSRIRAAPRASP